MLGDHEDIIMGEYKGKEIHLQFSWRDFSCVMIGISLAMTSICVIHVNPRKEYGAKNDGSYYNSYCSAKVYTLVEYMESGESNLLS